MTARRCFTAKIAAGKVSERAGKQLLGMLDAFEADARQRLGDSAAAMRRAASEASIDALAEAARKADTIHRTIRAQSDILRGVKAVEDRLAGLRAAGKAPVGLKDETRAGTYTALSAFLDSDPRELASYNNVAKLTRDIIGRAHATFGGAIERMRSTRLGFKDQRPLEIDFLRAALGEADVPLAAKADAEGWFKTEGALADGFIDAGGQLAKRERYFPNPAISEIKARAVGEARFKQLIRDNVDRDKIIDFNTDQPMGDHKFERLLDQAWRSIAGITDEAPSAAFPGKPLLSNARDAPRLFAMRDAAAWMRVADAIGEHNSPFYAATEHINAMARDTALMRILGPNPPATLRFMLDVLKRDPGKLAVSADDLARGGVAEAAAVNERVTARNRKQINDLQNLYGEVSGTSRATVNSISARRWADARAVLVASQLGSALISSMNDIGTVMMTARFNGLPAMQILKEAVANILGPGSEARAAQNALIMDTLAHAARGADSVMGDVIRTGTAAKLGGAVIRASGLRKWTEGLKHGFALGAQAELAAERTTPFAELALRLKAGLERYGIGEAEWKIFAKATPSMPRPNARFLTPLDVAALGGKEAQLASEKLALYLNSVLDHAVLEPTPRLRAKIIGGTRAGTAQGELMRSVAMYRFFSGGMLYMHGAQALARGWDGSRLGHAGLTMVVTTLLGALSMQMKEIAAGRDPRTLDPSTPEGRYSWGAALLQGGGLGIFGDILQVDKTKYGNSWASTFAGPIAGAAEDAGGRFLLGNVEKMIAGKPTHFGGDAAWLLARYMPGSSLWYAKLPLQRAVLDQLALMTDDRARERFAHIESQARQEKNQSYWWHLGSTSPDRMPTIAGTP